jgi:hypothetical protein
VKSYITLTPDDRIVVLGGYNNKEGWLDSVEMNPGANDIKLFGD